MKKGLLIVITLILILSAFALISCTEGGDEVKVYRIYYFLDGSDGIRYEVGVTQNEHYSIKIPTKDHYVFLGLFDAEEGGTKYVNASGMSVDKYVQDGDITLYAHWQPESYTLRFNLNGGVGAVSDMTVSYKDSLTALPLNVTKEGYNFIGWFSAPEGGVQYADKNGILPGKVVLNEDNYVLSADKIVNFYARYEIIILDVTFNANGHAKNGTEAWTVQIPYGETIDLYAPVDAVFEEGSWSGISKWSHSRASSTAYTQPVTENITLYAQTRSLVIALNSNGGGRAKSIFAEAGQTVALPVIERKGYTFNGWLDKNNAEQNYTEMPSTGDSLKADWTLITYTLTYVLDGGSLAEGMENPLSYNVETETFTLNAPTKNGTDFKFLGWYKANGEKVESIEKGSVGNITLTAKWKDVSKFAGFTEITTAAQLKTMANNPAGNYYLSADIDMKNEEWTPVGRYGATFSGIFDGNGYTVSNMKITVGTNHVTTPYSETEDIIVVYIGMFGSSSGTIRNVGVVNINVNVASVANIYGGGLVGYNAGKVENCYVTGAITISSSYKYGCDVGGLVGSNGGEIKNCYSTASVSATATSTASTAYVSGGGFCGTLLTTAGKLTGCFSTGNVTLSCPSGTVYAGKFLGDNYGAGTVSACYFLSSATLFGGTDAGSKGISAEEANLTASSFLTANMGYSDEIWNITGTAYPVLIKK